MFGRDKNDDSRRANRLSDESEANVLSGDVSVTANADPFADPETLYGPHGEAVAGLVESLDAIDTDQVEAVAEAAAAVRPADRQIAQMMARRLRNDRRLDAPLRAAEGRIREWLESREPVGDREASLYDQVAEAARDAVAALILDDELNDADFATLYGPWSDVMDEDVDEADEGDEDAEADEGGPEDDGSSRQEIVIDSGRATDDFGPNRALIVELLDRLPNLSPERLRSLSGAWVSADRAALARARAALDGALEADPDSRDELKLAQARVGEWAGEGDVRLRKVAAPAVEDAVSALAMADAISEADAIALYGPWAYAVGEPELPSVEDEDPS